MNIVFVATTITRMMAPNVIGDLVRDFSACTKFEIILIRVAPNRCHDRTLPLTLKLLLVYKEKEKEQLLPRDNILTCITCAKKRRITSLSNKTSLFFPCVYNQYVCIKMKTEYNHFKKTDSLIIAREDSVALYFKTVHSYLTLV